MIILLISISIHAVWGSGEFAFMRLFIPLATCYFLRKAITSCLPSSAGSSLSDQVHQTPAALIKNQADSAELNCRHDIQSYNVILWYKQSDTGELVYLGYMLVTSGYPEAGFKITGSANQGQTCTLTIEQLSSDSSAVYFCAASLHSGVNPLCSIQKRLPDCAVCVVGLLHTPA